VSSIYENSINFVKWDPILEQIDHKDARCHELYAARLVNDLTENLILKTNKLAPMVPIRGQHLRSDDFRRTFRIDCPQLLQKVVLENYYNLI